VSQNDAAIITALATIGSVLVAFAALRVATGAKDIANDSVRVAEQSVATARRQVALAAVPHLVTQSPLVHRAKLLVRVVNVGVVPALAVRIEAEGAQERFIPVAETEIRSNALANLAPSKPADLSLVLPESMRTADPGGQWQYPFLVVRVIHHGPHGARVVQSYDWNTASHAWRYRVIDIDPGDGGEPIHVEMSL
jgi:hypothetical protein